MKLHTNSWHYRFTYNAFTRDFGWLRLPHDFCTYVRQFIKVALLYVVIAMAVTAAPVGFYQYFMYGAIDNWHVMSLDGMPWFVILPVMLWWFLAVVIPPAIAVLTLAALIIGGVYLFLEELMPRMFPPKDNPEPSMATQAYRAWKDKYCPIIEVVNDDD